MNWPDQRRILRGLNRWLTRRGLDTMTTLAAMTYYPPKRRLSYSYAGHPPGWLFSSREGRWLRLALPPASSSKRADSFQNGALGVVEGATYSRGQIAVAEGDRLVLITDGVIETPSPKGKQFGADGFEALLSEAGDVSPGRLGEMILDGLAAYAGGELTHDDVTFLIADLVPSDAGSMLGQVVKNRLLRPLGFA
jgi:serine phosphatase RsbU (regulator of sigma subunit)